MSETASGLLHAVTEVAQLAGRVALAHYRSRLVVETKRDGSPVTIADRAAEQAARAWIDQRFPADGVLGEEFGATRALARRRWVLDPIDGTKSFVRGVPLWGTLVAVLDGDDVLAGAACFPAVDEVIAAAPGEGCWHGGSRARVSAVAALDAATVLTTDDRFPARPARRERWQSLAARAAVARTWGDCYGYLLVATGRAEAMIDDRVNAWDAAAFLPIITEAGGVATDWRGAPSALGGDFIATNARLGDDVRALLVESRP